MTAAATSPWRGHTTLSTSGAGFRQPIPQTPFERPELEGLDSEYSPEYLVEPEFIKDQTEVGQK